jgi:hypothetical protein
LKRNNERKKCKFHRKKRQEMQFLANGPDIPEVLLGAHEKGRVVFFCGSGISYPAGLPCFSYNERGRLPQSLAVGYTGCDMHSGAELQTRGEPIKVNDTTKFVGMDVS